VPDHTCPCPICGHPLAFVGYHTSIAKPDENDATRLLGYHAPIATWDCRQPRSVCKMGGCSEYVWPQPGGTFIRLPSMTSAQLRTALETARTADYPELVSALEKELASRSRLADAAGRVVR
jgi:hypothetical protein